MRVDDDNDPGGLVLPKKLRDLPESSMGFNGVVRTEEDIHPHELLPL